MSEPKPNLDSLFLTAAEIESPAEREAFLDQACGRNTELRRQVEKLLNSNEAAGSFLEKPAPVPGNDDVSLAPTHISVWGALNEQAEIPRVLLQDIDFGTNDPVERVNSAELPPNEADSRYQLQGEIARGGMGAVLKGRDTDLGRELAIKVLLESHRRNPEVIQRFVEEAQIGGQLQHPGIAPVYELGQFADKRPFFSMKLIKGQTLSRLLADREDASEDRARFLGIFEQVCQTMAYAHSRGVIHRDLKPANIMVGAFGEVQVMDWGLAKVLKVGGVADEKNSQLRQSKLSVIGTLRNGVGSDTQGVTGGGSETQMGSVMGTPAYMPPEQAVGEIDNLDERADVFGLGAILCEILTGQPPYVSTGGADVFRQAVQGKLDDCLSRLDACGADEDLIALTKQCLEPEPKARPRHAGELAERLTEYLESVETRLREAETQRSVEAARAIEARKRMRVTMALAATVVLSLAAGGMAWRWMDLKAIERREAATERINSALSDALVSQSRANSVDLNTQVVELELAIASAQQAADLASTGDVEPSLARRAETLLADLESRVRKVRQRAEQERMDRDFEAELELIRLSQSDGLAVTVALGDPVEMRKASIINMQEQVSLGGTAEAEPDADAGQGTGENPADDESEAVQGDDDEPAPDEESAVTQIFDISSTLDRYDDAFRNAGLNLRALTVSESAELVRSSAIQETLIGAIDNWARELDAPRDPLEGRPSNESAAGLSRTKLLAIANASDNSEWRRTVRTSLEQNDTAHLKELAVAEGARSQSPELIAWLGAALRDGDEVEHSIAVLTEAQRNHPGDFWLNYELSKSYVRQGQFQEGLGFARTALGIRPESDGARIALAIASSEAGRHRDAMNLYRTVLERNPRLYDAHTGLGLTATQMGDWDTAIAAYQTAIELKPDNGEVYGAMALALRSARRYDEAVRAARRGVELDPENVQAHVFLGRTLQGLKLRGRPQNVDALAAYERAIALDPDNAQAFCYLGQFKCRYVGRIYGIEDLRTAIRIDPNHTEAWGTLGYELFRRRKYEEALATYEKVVAISPASSLGYRRRIRPLLALGRVSEALANGRRAIALNPQDGYAHAFLGSALRRAGKIEEAIDVGRRAVEIEPDSLLAVSRLADSMESRGDTDAFAIHSQIFEWVPESRAAAYALIQSLPGDITTNEMSQIRGMVNRFPENDQLLNGFAWRLVTNRDEDQQFRHLDDAVRWAEIANRLKPETAAILNTLGVAYYREGKWQAAIKALQESLSQQRDEPSDSLFLAMAYQQLGDRTQSLEYYAQALRLRGSDTVDRETESFYKEARRLLDAHPDELNRLLAEDPENGGLARELADVLLRSGGEKWIVLEPTEMNSEGGATLTMLEDNSILASGENSNGDRYTIVTQLPVSQISALRIEALTHHSLPNHGPGRQQRDAGNFGLTQFEISYRQQDDTTKPVVLESAISERRVRSISVNTWNCAGMGSRPHTAVFSLKDPLERTTEGSLQFRLQFESNVDYPGSNLGRFRLSVCGDAKALDREKVRFAALNLTDPWTKLAAAWHIVGNQREFERVIAEHRPDVSLELVKLMTESVTADLTDQHNNESLSQLLQIGKLAASLETQHPEPEWIVLQPTEVTSQGGAMLTTLDDHSVLASGENPDGDVVEFETRLVGQGFTAIRLEGLVHESLPYEGHGRSPQGNVALSEIEAAVAPLGATSRWRSIQLGEAWADHHQFYDTASNAIDGNLDTDWGTEGYVRREDRTAIFAATTPFGRDSGLRLRIRMHYEAQSKFVQRTFGRFRLSVTSDLDAVGMAEFRRQLNPILASLQTALGNAHGQLGQTTESANAFLQAFDMMADQRTRSHIVEQASVYNRVLERLTHLRPDNAAFHATLARQNHARGELSAAQAALTKARTLYEHQLAAEPKNVELVSQLADLLMLQAELATTWTTLKPTEMKSEGGATLIALDDHSVLASGENIDGDAYTIVTPGSAKPIHVLRLEALTHESLPNLGPGRQQVDAGNFALKQFAVGHREQGGAVTQATLKNVVADYAAFELSVNRWNCARRNSMPHAAVYSLSTPLNSEENGQLQFEMRFGSNPASPGSNLGRFRLSVSSDAKAFERENARFAALKLTDPWKKLAAGYHLVDDQQALEKILKQHPDTQSVIDGLTAEGGN